MENQKRWFFEWDIEKGGLLEKMSQPNRKLKWMGKKMTERDGEWEFMGCRSLEGTTSTYAGCIFTDINVFVLNPNGIAQTTHKY